MRQSTRKYLASGQFIHDELVLRCNEVVAKLYDLWKKSQRIDPGVLAWPETTVMDDGGYPIDGIVSLPLPAETERHDSILRKLVERVSPYGIFVVRQEPHRVRAILETPKGTRTWIIPIERSADVYVLGATTIRDDQDSLGLVQKENKTQS